MRQHVYVSVPPYLSISKLVQLIKGKSSRKIHQNFPELKKDTGLWVFVRTSGNVTDEMIKIILKITLKKKINLVSRKLALYALSQSLDFNP